MSFDKQQLPPLYPNGTFNQPKKYEKYSTLPPSNERNLNIEKNPLQNNAPYQGIPGFDRDFNNNNNNKSAISSKLLQNNNTATSSAYIHPNATLRSQNSHQNTKTYQNVKNNQHIQNHHNGQNPQNTHLNHHFTTPQSSSSSDPSQKQRFNQNSNFTSNFSILSLLNKYSTLITSQSSSARQLAQALLVYHQTFHHFLEAKSKLFTILQENYSNEYPEYTMFTEAVKNQKDLCEKTMQTLDTRSHRALIQRTSSYLNQFPVAIKSLRLAIDTVRKNDELQERLQTKFLEQNYQNSKNTEKSQHQQDYRKSTNSLPSPKNPRHSRSKSGSRMSPNEAFSEMKVDQEAPLPEGEVFELLRQLPGLYDCRIQMLASTVGEIVDLERKLFGQLFTQQGKIAPIICELERQFSEGKLKSEIKFEIGSQNVGQNGNHGHNIQNGYNNFQPDQNGSKHHQNTQNVHSNDRQLHNSQNAQQQPKITSQYLLRDWKQRRELSAPKNIQNPDFNFEEIASIRPEDSISNIEPNLTESEVNAITNKENCTVVEVKPVHVETTRDSSRLQAEYDQHIRNLQSLEDSEQVRLEQAHHDTMEVGVGQAELHSRQHSKISALPSYNELMTHRVQISRKSSGHTSSGAEHKSGRLQSLSSGSSNPMGTPRIKKTIRQSPTLNKIMHEIGDQASLHAYQRSSLPPPPISLLKNSGSEEFERPFEEIERPFTLEDTLLELPSNHGADDFQYNHAPQHSTSTILRNNSYNDALNAFDDSRYDTIKSSNDKFKQENNITAQNHTQIQAQNYEKTHDKIHFNEKNQYHDNKIKIPQKNHAHDKKFSMNSRTQQNHNSIKHKPNLSNQPTFSDLMPPGYLFSAQVMKPYKTVDQQEMTIGEIIHVVARNSAGMEAENGDVFGVRNSQWSSDVPLDFRTQLLTLPAWCVKPLDEFV